MFTSPEREKPALACIMMVTSGKEQLIRLLFEGLLGSSTTECPIRSASTRRSQF